MNMTTGPTQGTGTTAAANGLNKVIGALDKVGVFSRWTNAAGLGMLFLMIVVAFIDVFARYVFNRPIKGVQEITEVIMICAIFLAVAHTQNIKNHIAIDLFSSKLKPKPRLALEFITTLFSVGVFGIVAWQTLKYAIFMFADHRVHDKYLGIPSGPFAAIIFIGSAAICLLLIRDLLVKISESSKVGLNLRHWLVMIGVPVLFTVFAYFWMQPGLWNIDLLTVGLLGVVFSLVLMMTGMPVAYALILTSFIFIAHIRNVPSALNMIGTETYRNSGSYNWAVVPFFVLMGYYCLYARFGEDIYDACYKWFGHMRGGLSIATIGAGSAFSAIVGDPLSSVATIGAAALPQMRKYKYDDVLSAGCIIGGATLGPIIPPSVPFVVYGLLTGVSVSALLISGTIPGLVMTFLFMVIIYIWCRLRPNVGPPGGRTGWGARFVSLKAGGPVLILFVLVMGGIWVGVFTPTEGGAIGAVVSLILGLAWRRFTWKSFTQTLVDSGKVISMVFLVLIGAVMYTRFLAWCNVSQAMTDLVTNLGLHPMAFVVFTLLLFFILGFAIDIMPLMLIGVPVLHPIAVSLGIDPIWFACLVVIAINLGDITPPVGVSLFTLRAISKDLPVGTIFRGAMPFVYGTVITIVIIFFIPSVATWLPNLMK